tara:strand:+ start:1774 stop:2196 length:423 start_codon:yes stop_codon:yes gene_type:complete
MKLVYINKIGLDWTGNRIYEFLFSDSKTTKDVHGSDWDSYPASVGQPGPPGGDFISKVGKLTTELNLDLIQNSDSFAVFDAVDGVIALAWENLLDYEEYPEKRLFFGFGEGISSVEDKLYEKDLILKYKVYSKKNEEDED